MKYSATFSDGGPEKAVYRYALRRDWRDEVPLLVFRADQQHVTVDAEDSVSLMELQGHICPNHMKLVLFIMLNPSTASDTTDDPTISKCMRMARKWGFGGIEVRNLFAFRSPYPAALKKFEGDPVGPKNDLYMLDALTGFDVGMVVAAWGNDGKHRERSHVMRRFLHDQWHDDVYAFKITKTGEPEHPLYQREDIMPNNMLRLRRPVTIFEDVPQWTES